VAESDPLSCAAMEHFSDTHYHGNAPSVQPFARSRHLQTHHSRRKAFRGDLNPSVGYFGGGGGMGGCGVTTKSGCIHQAPLKVLRHLKRNSYFQSEQLNLPQDLQMEMLHGHYLVILNYSTSVIFLPLTDPSNSWKSRCIPTATPKIVLCSSALCLTEQI